MTAAEFHQWLADVKSAGLAKTDRDALALIGKKSPTSALAYKERGADTTTALACAAVLAGLGPYRGASSDQPPHKGEAI